MIPIIYRKKKTSRFYYMEVSERRFKKGYSKNWEVIQVKNWIDGMIKSNLILEKEREEERKARP